MFENGAKKFIKSLTLTWSLLVWSGRYFCVKSFISRDISQHDHLVHTYKIDLEWMSFCKEHHLKICKKYKTEQHLDTAFEFSRVFNLELHEEKWF